MFTHHMASVMYKDLPFDQKNINTITLLIISGVVGIVLGKLILSKDKELKNSSVENGLTYGGWILIITALFVKWQNTTDGLKLILTACFLIYVIWLSYKYFSNNEKTSNEDLSADDFA